MRLFSSYSTVLLNALLAASAAISNNVLLADSVVGEFDQAASSNNASSAIFKRSRGQLGPMPKVDFKKMSRYCGQSQKKTSKRDSEEHRDKRTAPAGALVIHPNQGRGATPQQPVLFSEGFGTCIGVVAVGRSPAQRNDRFLYHFAVPNELAIRRQFLNLVQDVDNAHCDVTHVWMYTIDTRRDNPLRGQLGSDLDAMEPYYASLLMYLTDLNPNRRIQVLRVYHQFGPNGQITVPARGAPQFDPINP